MSAPAVQLAKKSLDELSSGAARRGLEQILAESIVSNRWFGGKARTLQSLALVEVVLLTTEHCLVLLTVGYADGQSEEYLMPLSLASGAAAEKIRSSSAQVVAAVELAGSREPAVLYDSLTDEQAAAQFLRLVRDERELTGTQGQIVCRRTHRFGELCGPAAAPEKTTILKSQQSNSSVVFDDRLILKLFRRPEQGINPDVEVTTYLTERVGFQHVPPVVGTIEYRRRGEPSRSLAVVQGFVPNQGVAWEYTLEQLRAFYGSRFFETAHNGPPSELFGAGELVALADRPLPEAARQSIGPFLQDAELLGRRTAELHLALASQTSDENFRPEPFTPAFQEAAYEAACRLTERTFQLLQQSVPSVAVQVQLRGRPPGEFKAAVLNRFCSFTWHSLTGQRIRVHGDYHLGQVLYTGQDFVIIDFEGEPIRPLAERRIKSSPLRDVAGMLRSFDYAAHSALSDFKSAVFGGAVREGFGDTVGLSLWAEVWNTWTGVAFLRSYLQTAAGSALLPESSEEVEMLLDVLLLEKAVYELQYELNNRPDWVPIPLKAVLAVAGR